MLVRMSYIDEAQCAFAVDSDYETKRAKENPHEYVDIPITQEEYEEYKKVSERYFELEYKFQRMWEER